MNSPEKIKWSRTSKVILFVFVGIGILSFTLGLFTDSKRAWANFLLEYFYWLCIALAGIFFTALQHITGSTWSASIRRVSEAFIGYLPVAVLLFVGLLFGLHDLFEWTHSHVMEADPILHNKSVYLNTPFFIIRQVLLFVLCFTLGRSFIRNSLTQDETGDVRLTKKNVKLSAPFLFLFAWLFSFVAIDLMMSLSPHWFSTVFGVYCWAGLFTSGLAMITLWVIFLKRKGVLMGFVNENHIHDLGKLMFAFMVFWAYIAFSQYMLIWYANLPEETTYMISRTEGDWQKVSIALLLMKFVIPFFCLISRFAKRIDAWLVLMALLFLAGQWVDVYWMVFPTFFKTPVFGWMEIGMFIGFLGLFLLAVGYRFSKALPIAIKDPNLKEALHFHQ